MKLLLIIMIMLYTLAGCRMFTAWRSIPAPGGCEECHKVPITSNWQLSYRPATLTDERGGQSFQQPASVMPAGQKPVSPLETKKVNELPCFECHNAPDASHRQLKGTFHH